MTAAHRGRGRRDNGLQAPLWAPLRDVDPRVGEHLLDLLREEGIAAYLEPATDVSPYTRTVHLPSPPSDRLFVDRARRADARAVVDRHGDTVAPAASTGSTAVPHGGTGPRAGDAPSRRPISADPEFAAIVAAFEAEHGRPTEPADAPLPPPPPAAEPSVLDAPDEHFEPPPAPPVPMLAPIRLYCLLLILAGAVCIVAPTRIGLSSDTGLVLGVAGVVAGVAVLVSRMRERSTDDGDDGAVV